MVGINLYGLAGFNDFGCQAHVDHSRDTVLAGHNTAVGEQTTLIHYYCSGWEKIRDPARIREGGYENLTGQNLLLCVASENNPCLSGHDTGLTAKPYNTSISVSMSLGATF